MISVRVQVFLSDLEKLKKVEKKQESDEEAEDADFNPYLDPEDREGQGEITTQPDPVCTDNSPVQ